MTLTNTHYKITIAILALLLLFTCTRTSEPKTAVAKNKIDNAKEKINSLAKQLEASNEIIKNQKAKEAKLINNVFELQKSKSDLQKSYSIKLQKAKSYNKADIATFFVERYKLPNDVKTIEYGTQISDTVAKLSIVDLIGGDKAIEELDLTKKELYNFRDLVSVKSLIITEREKKEVNLYGIITQKDTIIDATNDMLKATEKSLRKEKVKKNVWKITALGILGGATYLLIKK